MLKIEPWKDVLYLKNDTSERQIEFRVMIILRSRRTSTAVYANIPYPQVFTFNSSAKKLISQISSVILVKFVFANLTIEITQGLIRLWLSWSGLEEHCNKWGTNANYTGRFCFIV